MVYDRVTQGNHHVYGSADHSPEYVGIAVGCFADPNFPAT